MPWRRAVACIFSAVLVVMLWRIEERTVDTGLLRLEFEILAGMTLALLLTYFTGATLLDWAGLVTALRAKKAALEHASKRDSHDASGSADAPPGA